MTNETFKYQKAQRNRMAKTDEAFKAEVLTHLKYIREKQDRHDDSLKEMEGKIDGVHDRITKQFQSCSDKFGQVSKRIDTAEGFAKGAMAVGGGGGVLSFIMALFRWIK